MTVKHVFLQVDSGHRKAPRRSGQDVAWPRLAPPVRRPYVMTRIRSVVAAIAISGALGAVAQTLAPPALAVPAPEVEYTYNVVVRRHFDFPNNDALGYGFGICDKLSRGESYRDIMGEVQREVFPNDEQ